MDITTLQSASSIMAHSPDMSHQLSFMYNLIIAIGTGALGAIALIIKQVFDIKKLKTEARRDKLDLTVTEQAIIDARTEKLLSKYDNWEDRQTKKIEKQEILIEKLTEKVDIQSAKIEQLLQENTELKVSVETLQNTVEKLQSYLEKLENYHQQVIEIIKQDVSNYEQLKVKFPPKPERIAIDFK